MDSITQAVLGASIQGALLGRWQGRKALVYGAALATLPDLDVLIDYGDAVADMTYHRGFSHSLFVLTGLALLLTWLCRRFRSSPGYSSQRLFWTLWLVLITHPILDSFTSYGTQLFWPMTPTPAAWSNIFIIDPLYTLPLLIAVIVGLITGLHAKGVKACGLALLLSSAYIGFTFAGKHMAQTRLETELARQHIQTDAVFSTPTPFNSLLWRAIVIDGDDYYESLISWFDRQPPKLERIPLGTQLAQVLTESPAHDRLAWFTDNLLRYDHVDDQLVVTDIRLGMTGYHPFRFAFATLRDGSWQLAEEIPQIDAGHGDLSRLKLLWQRIWNQDVNIPLAAWADELSKAQN